MSKLLSLDSSLLLKIVEFLSLKDVIRFASCCRQLQYLTFETAEVWSSDRLFENDNQDIDDQVIATIVPRITRSYDIHSLRLIGLHKVSSIGILQIFDQFAHALKDIEICTSMKVVAALTRHLEAFSLKLAMLQAANSIPLTFMEYRSQHMQYIEQLTSYMSQSPKLEDSKNAVSNAHAELSARLRWLHLPTKLDDPPFEQLEKIKITISDDDSGSNKRICTVLKLRSLISYLSGANLESDLDSEIQPHSEAHVDRWYSINRKQKVADLDANLEMQPTIIGDITQLNALNKAQNSDDEVGMLSELANQGVSLPLKTPSNWQETPTNTTPPDNHKRNSAHAEPRPFPEESKRPRRSSPTTTQPVVKVYRYRRRRSSDFEQQQQEQQRQLPPHLYRPSPVSN
ncbi:unnamed protein product [Umbelopsis vinacea]